MAKRRPVRRRPRAAQRGSVYVLVLGITTMLVVFGITGAMIARVTVEQARLQESLTKVRMAAEVGIDVKHKRLNGTTSWRSSVGNNNWSSSEAIADAKVYYKYVDEFDGSLSNDNTQPFRMYCKAEKGDAVRVYSVEFVSDSAGNLTRRPRTMRQEAAD